MDDQDLLWVKIAEKELLHTPVFDVMSLHERSSAGLEGDYVAMVAPDWVMTIPVYQDSFLMVRQWRHALGRVTTEFPGGVKDPGETPEEAAKRELLEETGFLAGRLTHLGSCSPNPALFRNRFHVFLAQELIPNGEQHLDADEFLHCFPVPIGQVLDAYGNDDYAHALMGTALAFYMRHVLRSDEFGSASRI